MMMGNVRTKELSTEVFLKLLQLSKSCIGRGMRPALVVPYLREILVKGETTRAERRLLARTDKQLYTWFRECFLTAKVRAGVQELGEKLDVTRRDRMVATLRVASQIVERGLVLGQTGPPVEQYQGGVEAEPEAERAREKRRVAEPDVVEEPERDIENWQPGRQSQEAAQPSGTSKKKLNSGEETGKRDSQEVRE